ncbi:MAG TPA: TonB-dependent receptor [Vicinamibacterales bacterium]|nr:TonB-dependent receptor [Vicinamibacterales bacterium]
MKLFCRFASVVAMLALATGSMVRAQQIEARVVGKVVDQSQAVLPGVTVTVTSVQTGAVRTAVSGAEGTYTVTNLNPGRYVVQLELAGFQTRSREITLGVGQTETVDGVLSVGGVTEAINVSASAPVLDTSSARLGVNVSPEEVQNLPVNGRNFANLMTLAPGATSDGNGGWASVRFNGKSNQQNYLNYDGVDGTYVWDASPGYLNATGSQFRLQTSMESVAEFRVNSGLAPAESGLGAGGNITVVSKSGGNRFTGSLFEYVRNDALDSASKYDDRKQNLELNQFGGSLGGPIASNRTFFFFSYEGLQQKTGLSFTEAVPSDLAIQRINAGQFVGTQAGLSAARTQAVAPLLAGFPRGTAATNNPLLALATLDTQAEQKEHSFSVRMDHRFNNNQMLYGRLLFSDGEVDTPDRTVTPRRVLATQQPINFVANHQSIFGTSVINELKIGYNRPKYDALAFGPAGYDPIQVSLSGTVTSQSADARGTTGVARSGLLVRATSNASTNGQAYNPHSLSLSNALSMTRGGHSLKIGGEYRKIDSQFRFLGSTEITYADINAFIDNRPQQVAVSLDSPVFHPQQWYGIGFVQDTWRVSDRLTLELGLRYDFYSVVKERDNLARPFFIEDNDFASGCAAPATSCAADFYDPDKNNFAPRLSAVFQLTPRTLLRAGYGHFYGPGQFEDRIQPIENYIERQRVQDTQVVNLAYPVDPATYRNLLSVRGYTHERPDEYNVQYGASVSQELPYQVNLTVGYTGSRGKDMFLRGVANTFNDATRVRLNAAAGQVDYKTSGCVDGLVIAGRSISGCGRASYDAFQISTTRRFHIGFTGGLQYQYSRNKGTTQGSNEAVTASNTFDYDSEYGTNQTDIPHSFNGSLIYMPPFDGPIAGGWRIGGIVNARSGVPINVTINRPDTVSVGGVTVTNVPGGNSRGTQRPDLVPGVNPYLKDGVRWLNPAAFAAPMPGTFGNLPRNFLRGPNFWQLDMMASKDIRFSSSKGLQLKIEVFNLTNRLNYENPAAVLPAGTVGQAFTDGTAGTFGYMLGPLNRTVGLGTARQTQISVRYLF